MRLPERRNFKKRYDVLNYFARLRNCKRYLEIGVGSGRSFARVRCPEKLGVDPNPRGIPPEWNVQRVTSDDFFAMNRSRFDLVLVDGLHLAGQALRDTLNALAVLAPGGVVVLHDCNPLSESSQLPEPRRAEGGTWNGDVWKAVVFVRERLPEIFCRVLAIDHGVGVVIPLDYGRIPALTVELENEAGQRFGRLAWNDLAANRAGLLGLLRGRADLEAAMERAGVAVPRAAAPR